MYLLAIGDYDTGGFDNQGQSNKIVLWVVFLAATFFIQLTFMNMLIAIMGNTFEEVIEKQN